MIRSIAVDDEPKALSIIRNHADRIDFLDLALTFTDPYQALTYVSGNEIDLLFLDIQMPELSGLDLLKSFQKPPLIIFTTAHSEYAVASYEVEAVDYLLKPFDFSRFFLAVTRAKERLEQAIPLQRSYFFISSGKTKVRLSYDDIYYLEGAGNYVTYFTKEGKQLVRTTIREALSQLPDNRFFQIHRSYVVALPLIEKVQDHQVTINGARLPISAGFREAFYEELGR